MLGQIVAVGAATIAAVYVANDDRVRQVIIPIGDGLTMNRHA